MRRKLIGLIFLCLAVRVVTPAGFMPAPIGEGGPFVLCPGGMSGGNLILAALASAGGEHNHGEHHRHDSGGSHLAEFCPFGVVFGSTVVVNTVEPVLPGFTHILVSTGPRIAPRGAASHAFRARAPPSPTSRYI